MQVISSAYLWERFWGHFLWAACFIYRFWLNAGNIKHRIPGFLASYYIISKECSYKNIFGSIWGAHKDKIRLRNRYHNLCFALIGVFCHIKGIFDLIFGLEAFISLGDAGQNIAYVKEGFRASASQIQRVFVGKILRSLSVGSMLHIAFLTECRQY